MRYIMFDNEKKYIKDFINLPKRLYIKDNTETENETVKILTNTHTLSKYFQVYKFLFYSEDKVVGRFIITAYPDDKTAYLGFYECIDDKNTSDYVLEIAYEFAKNNGFDRLTGPVDSSFWIKYRLKINMFDKEPYTGEPYNKEYYLKQFLDNDYQITQHYTSSIYKPVDYDYINEKYKKRYDDFISKGYKIISPDINEFESTIKQVYYLLTELYSDFPIYKSLSEKDFTEIFSSYKSIINMSMVKMAYYNGKLTGFFISVPNYNNLVYHLNIINVLKLIKLKRKPKEYVMLYMGVDQEHKGLGKALAYSIIKELRQTGLSSIGALARDGKVTQNYVDELIEDRYEYVLLERVIND